MDKNYIILSRIITLLHPDVQIECQDVPNAGCYIVTMTKKKQKWKIFFLCNICFKYWLKVFISSKIQIDNLYKIGNQLSKNQKLTCGSVTLWHIQWNLHILFTKCIFHYLSMSLLRFLVNLYLFSQIFCSFIIFHY